MRIDKGNYSSLRKHAPAQLCPAQISHGLACDRTRAAEVGSRLLTASDMALFNLHNKILHGLSSRANYTDRATVAYERSDCQLFADRECHVVSVTDPYSRILDFLDRSRYLSIK
jgi:hypothetical protein